MFDIGFFEMVVIAVVALVVIGPERLPKAARTMGHLFGRLQRYVSDVKADINREMELDELRKLQREMQGAARDFEQSVTSAANDVKAGARSIERDLSDVSVPPQAGDAATAAEPRPADAASSRQAALPGFDKI